MCMCVCVCICISVFAPVCACECLCVKLRMRVCAFVCVCAVCVRACVNTRTFVRPVHDVDDPWRESGLVNELHKDHGCAGVALGRLQQHRVARHQRHREHLRSNGQSVC